MQQARHWSVRGVHQRWSLVLVVIAVFLTWTGSAFAVTSTPTPYTTITSAGPLTSVFVGNDLSCQVARAEGNQIFPQNATPGDCSTYLTVGGTVYAADFTNHTGSANSSPSF